MYYESPLTHLYLCTKFILEKNVTFLEFRKMYTQNGIHNCKKLTIFDRAQYKSDPLNIKSSRSRSQFSTKNGKAHMQARHSLLFLQNDSSDTPLT